LAVHDNLNLKVDEIIRSLNIKNPFPIPMSKHKGRIIKLSKRNITEEEQRKKKEIKSINQKNKLLEIFRKDSTFWTKSKINKIA